MTDDTLFKSYKAKSDGQIMQAAQLTDENAMSLSKTVGGSIVQRNNDIKVVFIDKTTDPALVELEDIGDYFLTDNAGAYVCVEKEVFEAAYDPVV